MFIEIAQLRGNIEINAIVTGAIVEGNANDYFNALMGCTEEGLTLTVSGTCEFIEEIREGVHNQE